MPRHAYLTSSRAFADRVQMLLAIRSSPIVPEGQLWAPDAIQRAMAHWSCALMGRPGGMRTFESPPFIPTMSTRKSEVGWVGPTWLHLRITAWHCYVDYVRAARQSWIGHGAPSLVIVSAEIVHARRAMSDGYAASFMDQCHAIALAIVSATGTRMVLRSIFCGFLLAAVGCAFGQDHLRAQAADDLSCPAHELVTRCVVGSKGSWVVTGCGRYAQYTKTTHGPRLEKFGNGNPPNEEWLCAKGF